MDIQKLNQTLADIEVALLRKGVDQIRDIVDASDQIDIDDIDDDDDDALDEDIGV